MTDTGQHNKKPAGLLHIAEQIRDKDEAVDAPVEEDKKKTEFSGRVR